MNETKELKVVVEQKSTKDGRKFNTFKTFSKNGRKTDLKFTKEVTNVPTKNCVIVVNVDDMNLDERGMYPIVWVKAIQEIKDTADVSKEKSRKAINDYFG